MFQGLLEVPVFFVIMHHFQSASSVDVLFLQILNPFRCYYSMSLESASRLHFLKLLGSKNGFNKINVRDSSYYITLYFHLISETRLKTKTSHFESFVINMSCGRVALAG